jgi:hypothetical protein
MIIVLQTFLLFWKMKSAIYKGETDYKFRAYGREEVQNKKLEVMLAVSEEGLHFFYKRPGYGYEAVTLTTAFFSFQAIRLDLNKKDFTRAKWKDQHKSFISNK